MTPYPHGFPNFDDAAALYRGPASSCAVVMRLADGTTRRIWGVQPMRVGDTVRAGDGAEGVVVGLEEER